MAAVLKPTSIMFPAGNCPAGMYTITALARNSGTGQSYTTTLKSVSLPRDSVEVKFQDLPLGTYLVSATSVSSKGDRFDSSVLAMTSVGDLGAGGGLGAFVRQRPPSVPAVGLARPRNAPPRETPGDRRATAPAGSADRPAGTGTIVGRSPVEIAFERFVTRLLTRIDGEIDIAQLENAGPDWRRVEAIDTDADGTIDSVTVELIDGDVWVFRIAR
jgi:hypothetical protein